MLPPAPPQNKHPCHAGFTDHGTDNRRPPAPPHEPHDCQVQGFESLDVYVTYSMTRCPAPG